MICLTRFELEGIYFVFSVIHLLGRQLVLAQRQYAVRDLSVYGRLAKHGYRLTATPVQASPEWGGDNSDSAPLPVSKARFTIPLQAGVRTANSGYWEK